MTYQLTSGSTILRLEDNAFIPPDPANTDYRDFLAWCDEGNTPLPTPEPEPIPEPTPEEKLAASGLTVDELKQLLGLSSPEEDTVLVRARNEDGTYVGDDPATPANEAYTEVPISEA